MSTHGTKKQSTTWHVAAVARLKRLRATPMQVEAATPLMFRLPLHLRGSQDRPTPNAIHLVMGQWHDAVTAADKLRHALADAERHMDEVAAEVPETVMRCTTWQAASGIKPDTESMERTIVEWAFWQVQRWRQKHSDSVPEDHRALADTVVHNSNVRCYKAWKSGHDMASVKAVQ